MWYSLSFTGPDDAESPEPAQHRELSLRRDVHREPLRAGKFVPDALAPHDRSLAEVRGVQGGEAPGATLVERRGGRLLLALLGNRVFELPAGHERERLRLRLLVDDV